MNNYILLKVEGNKLSKFLLKCNKNNINILKVIYKSYKSIIILINEYDYKKIIKIKGLNKIRIIDFKGINKIKRCIKKYKVFIISFLLGLILLYTLSNMIFSIEINGENNYLNKKIINELSYLGIDKYKFKKSYEEIELIKNTIKKKYKDNIKWIEIKEYGTKYIINYVEKKINKKENDSNIYSIVSKKNGVIKNIETYNGISLVDIDSYISKGEILISSDIILNDELKGRDSAKGKVYAETWYKVKVEYPLNYKEIKYLNKKRKTIYFKIGNKYYDLFKFKTFKREKKVIYKNNTNGFEFGFETIIKKEVINKKYSTSKALIKAKKEGRRKIESTLNYDERVINEKTLKYFSNGSKIIVDMFFSVYEEIGEKRIIEMGELYDTKDIRERIN